MDAVAVGVERAAVGREAPRRARAVEVEAPAPRIFAVGGGKGGVGKSIVASNLALALAATGQRTAVVDVDLGGANLHTLFGVARPRATLADFVRGDVADLAELLVPTSVPDVALISGARALPDMANPKHAQKSKLLRHLRRLPVQHVVLDLGAGSGFNVVDFFLAADRGLVVVTPEPTALDNAMQFLKAAFFRSLREVACEERVRAGARGGARGRAPAAAARRASWSRPPRAVDPEAGRMLRERVRRFAPLPGAEPGAERERAAARARHPGRLRRLSRRAARVPRRARPRRLRAGRRRARTAGAPALPGQRLRARHLRDRRPAARQRWPACPPAQRRPSRRGAPPAAARRAPRVRRCRRSISSSRAPTCAAAARPWRSTLVVALRGHAHPLPGRDRGGALRPPAAAALSRRARAPLRADARHPRGRPPGGALRGARECRR